jgi:hypothetical protein
MRPPFYDMYNTLMNSMDRWVQKYQAAQDFLWRVIRLQYKVGVAPIVLSPQLHKRDST